MEESNLNNMSDIKKDEIIQAEATETTESAETTPKSSLKTERVVETCDKSTSMSCELLKWKLMCEMNLEPKYKKLKIERRPVQKFPTGSKYVGDWNKLGMQGYGNYTLFYDVDYTGYMKDGMFHGFGTLYYPVHARMNGKWVNGQMQSYEYYFSDNKYHCPLYCEMPDRRFYLEILYGIRPAGRSLLTNAFKSRTIPKDCYDTTDGFYNPKTKCVYNPKNLKQIIRIPTKSEHEWIIKNCRKAWDEPVGYRPEFYENWSDRSSHVDEFSNKKSSSDSTRSESGQMVVV